MTKHLTLLIAFLIVIGSQVSAAETVMVCDAQNDSKLYFKLRDPLIGKSQVLVRAAGQWVIWEELDETRRSFVYDTGAKLVDTFDSKKLSATRTTVLDFEFGTHQSTTRIIKRDDDGETVSDGAGTLDFTCEIQQ